MMDKIIPDILKPQTTAPVEDLSSKFSGGGPII